MLRFFLVCLVTTLGNSVTAQTRHALVIGIDDYDHVEPLQKARNDARAVHGALEAAGFEADLLLDGTGIGVIEALEAFTSRLSPGDEAVFFFAGHGVELEGENILLPADIPAPERGGDLLVRRFGIPVQDVLDQIQRRDVQLSLLILDACRDNPFPRQGTRSLGGTRGLARMSAPEGTFIVYSAGAGQAALDRLSNDDPDPNSVFTRALLPRITTPGLELSDLVREVRSEVRQLARTVGHNQFPAFYDQLDGEFQFVPAAMTPGPEPADPQASCTAAQSVWAALQNTEDETALTAFATGYAASCPTLAAQARERLAALSAAPIVTAPRLIPDGYCALQVAAFADRSEAANFIATLGEMQSESLSVYQSGVGWSVVLATVSVEERKWWVEQARNNPLLPRDSFCSDGSTYAERIDPTTLRPTRDILRINDPTDGWLNFRTGPGTSHRIIRRLDNGVRVQVLRRSGRWAEVLSSGLERGWVFENYTLPVNN